MTRFIHKSVRLYTHLTRAYRLFTYPKEIEKWIEGDFSVELKEMGDFDYIFSFNCGSLNTKGSKILEFEKEKYLKILWKDDKYFIDGGIVELNYMSATSETEYCSEIHVVHRNLDDFPEDAVQFYKCFWTELFERARKKINGNWVIKDEELTLDCLK